MFHAPNTLEDPDAPLQLDKSLFVATLQRLKEAASIEALRRATAELRNELDNPKSTLRVYEGDIVEIGRGYLISELDQISGSLTLERGRYYVERFIKAVVEVRTNAVNDINLNRWKEYEDIYIHSLWMLEKRDNSGVHNADYWGNFIPQIPYQLMRRYTKSGDWVLDTFMGSGTTLIESQRLGRHGIGVELQAEVAARARTLIAAEPNTHGVINEIITGDSALVDYRAILERHGRQSVQLVIMHPPYFDIIKFSDDPRDLSNAGSIEVFLERIGQVVQNAAAVLQSGRYLGLVIGDTYARGEWIPLGFLCMNEVLRRGFLLKSIVVKNFEETTGKRNQKELWKYRALAGGFYIFKHEYIFVCEKR